MNPLEEYLLEKKALGPFTDAFKNEVINAMRPGVIGRRLGQGVVAAGTTAVGTGLVGAGVVGAQKLYDAVTKARDFRRMLEENEDVAAKHREDPRLVNKMFTTLRTFNPAFSQDPVVAGNYVRTMVEFPESAGGKVVETLNFRDKTRNPVGEQVLRSVMGGSRRNSP